MTGMLDLKVCPKCGNTTDADNPVCPYCGYSLGKHAGPGPASRRAATGPESSHRGGEHDHVLHRAHSPLAAAIFSLLFVGWGQWYNGRMWDGVRFIGPFLLGALLFVLLELVIRVSTFAYALYFFFFLVMVGAWVFGIADAYSTARKIISGETAFAGKSRMFWFPVAVFLVIIGFVMFGILAAFLALKTGITLSLLK